MNIYKIKINSRHNRAGDTGTYEAHVIVANNIKEVVDLAKKNALAELASAWGNDGVEQLGVYTGRQTEPYIILSHLIYDAS